MNNNQLWGQGQKIMASQRRRISAKASSSSTSPGDKRTNTNVVDSEDDNLFDFIGRELDEREEETRRDQQQQQQCLQQVHHNDGGDSTNNNQMENTVGFSQSSHNDEVDFLPMRDDWSTTDGNGTNVPPVENTRRDQTSNNDNSHHQLEATEDNDAAMVVPITTSKRRREYSVVKSTTPRFSFQSASSAAKSATVNGKSPMGKHSISSPLLSSSTTATTTTTSDKQHPKKSAKRTHRHSFRQSIDRNASKSTAAMSQVNNNMRELGFAPKFLASSRVSGLTNDDAISSQLADGEDNDNDDNTQTKPKWNRLSSSQALTASPYKQSSSSRRNNKAGGYLIQNLRSLRNNDQRMVMRLRASTGGMARKRRRSGGGGVSNLGPKQAAASELDVTIMGATVPNQNVNEFGAGNIRLAYIRRYTGTVDIKKLPCYSWIFLPQNVMHEQSIGDGGGTGGSTTQLRCYDAIIIPPRVASVNAESGQPIPLNELEEHELPLPTIICANVCERCTTDTCTNNDMSPMHEVSFDMLCK